MKNVFKSNLYLFLIILAEIIGGFILIPIICHVLKITDIRLVLLLTHMITLIFPAIIYFIVTKSNIKEKLRLNKLKIGDVFLVILIGFIAQPALMFFSVLSSLFFKNNVGEVMLNMLNSPYIILLLLIAVMPAITEEITIRGIVLSGYNNVNKYKAALVTGLFFGILHLDAQQFIYTAVLGFILALVVRITNSIFSSVIIHFIFNATSITMQKLLSTFAPNMIKTSQQADSLSLVNMPIDQKLIMVTVAALMSVAFGTLVWLILKYLQKRNPETIEDATKVNADGTVEKDRIINVPFILTIILYIIYMIFILSIT